MNDFHSQVLPAIERALLQDLPDISYKRALPGTRKDGKYDYEDAKRRPHRGDVQIYVFPQTWSNTALGFGGVAGQAFTSAYVTVVVSDHTSAAVYMGYQLAYVVPVSSDLMHDIGRQNIHDVAGAHKHYGRDPRVAA